MGMGVMAGFLFWKTYVKHCLPQFSYLSKSINFIEYDYKTGKILAIYGKPLWFWAE